ncbi:MAG: hypothetical protein KIS89_00470 [Dokdonella sp.]|nr:hypothetical protein [Dokdonella sp.]
MRLVTPPRGTKRALATLQAHAASERNPALLALHAAAQARAQRAAG